MFLAQNFDLLLDLAVPGCYRTNFSILVMKCLKDNSNNLFVDQYQPNTIVSENRSGIWGASDFPKIWHNSHVWDKCSFFWKKTQMYWSNWQNPVAIRQFSRFHYIVSVGEINQFLLDYYHEMTYMFASLSKYVVLQTFRKLE